MGGGELGWVLTARTRCEYIPVSSGRDVLSLTVPALNTHPSSGHVDGIIIEVFCEHHRSQWGVTLSETAVHLPYL